MYSLKLINLFLNKKKQIFSHKQEYCQHLRQYLYKFFLDIHIVTLFKERRRFIVFILRPNMFISNQNFKFYENQRSTFDVFDEGFFYFLSISVKQKVLES